MREIRRFAEEWAFLSNFAEAEVELEGVQFPTVEAAFQAAKTTVEAEREAIRQAATPGRAKRLGRKATLRAGWEAMRVEVMRGLLVQKFQIPALRAALLATGQAELVEGNTWGDVFWGVCEGEGQNVLGRLLTEVRAGLGEG
jgi:ribA/ribD-fused uncharacterized protein